MKYRRWIALFIAVGLVLSAWSRTSWVRGEEPVEAFLEGLRRRQMFDMAQAYLESLETSSLVGDEVRQTIPYELGRTLVDETRTLRDVNRRLELLEAAQQKFEQFVNENSQHPLAASAKNEMGNVLVERGRAAWDKSQRPVNSQEKDQLVTEARQWFEQARKVFDEAATEFEAELKSYPTYIDQKETELAAARNRALVNAIQARLLSGTVVFELAKTYPTDDEQRTKMLTDAAGQFAAIYEEHQRRLAGLYARMWQGRCYQELGDTKQALTYYGELLAQPDEPDEFRVLKRRTLRLALQCWLSEGEQKFDEAARQGAAWLLQARGNEPQTPEGLAIQYLTAEALDRRAETLDERDDQRGRDLRDATKLAAEVAKLPGEHQDDAKQLLARLRDVEAEGEPTTFADASARGKAALDAMTVAQNKLSVARRAQADTETIQAAESERADAQAEAARYFELAVTLYDDETSIEELNQVRYFLCYLLYAAERRYEAAVLGEFLARRYPESAGAKPGAKIALAAFLSAYNDAPPDERQFETRRMVEIASYVGERWPGSAEADEAWLILADLAIRSGEMDDAIEYLGHIGEESPQRSEADLKAGQALWTQYLNASRQDDEDRPAAAELERMLAQAREQLERGIERERKALAEGSAPPFALSTAELSLAQIYLTAAQAEQAIALLERPENGPLALVRANSPIVRQGNFASETLKAALRGYVGKQDLQQAEATMQTLEERVAQTGEGEAALTRIYVSLGRELEEQVARLRQEGKNDELKAVLNSFEQFLKKIADREQGNTFGSLFWVAETFYGLGEGLDGGGPATAESKAYYEQSARAWQKILDLAERDPSFAPQSDGGLWNLRVRLARCERRLGEYNAALKQLVTVLAAQPNALDAQIEAAYTFQAWGAEKPDYYTRANRGTTFKLSSGAQVAVWGWNQLANRVQASPQHRDMYHEARFNLAECSYLRAMSRSGAERSEGLQSAAKLIGVMARLDPTLGGEPWRDKYDRLLKQIQRDAGEPPRGLKALEASQPATAQR